MKYLSVYAMIIQMFYREELSMLKIMSAGPTQVRENVRMARSLETTNPDVDLAFYTFMNL